MNVEPLRRLRAALAAGALLAAGAALAEPLPVVEPEAVGLSSEQLDRLGDRLAADAGAGTIPGAVLLVLRDGQVAYEEAFGERDAAAGAPMTTDAIFRIYSMTKPITSVAAMQLVEEGRLSLTDPVSKHIPAFADLVVGEEVVDEGGAVALRIRPAARAMTVHDLLRHTSGLTYGVFGDSMIKEAYREAGIPGGEMTARESAEALAALPLVFDPGAGYEYGRSTDVLGAVIEAVEGRPLDQVLEERVFAPLGMEDTGFYVPDEADLARVAQPQADPETGETPRLLDPARRPVYLSGGGGLVSTARDYARFVQMLLNGGELDGARILGPATVAYMTADHLGAIPRGGPDGPLPGTGYNPGTGQTFGLGFAVREAEGMAPLPGSAGAYSWGGYAGTHFWVDPAADLAVVYMMQEPAGLRPYAQLTRNMVYPALTELGADPGGEAGDDG